MRYLKYILIIFLFNQSNLNALIEVDITRGNLNPLPIAVSSLSIEKASNEELQKILKKKYIGAEISKVVEKTLNKSSFSNINSIKDVIEIDKETRTLTQEIINSGKFNC